jgi:uncharacterized protein YyaL (SSP411 family)
MDEHQYNNRLIDESSPYLRQHAHNPVDWYAWGDEAFQRARTEDKPVLLSIGYSACHWCHVMERESFEDEETARIMNEHFVNIKVDMEERPDVDKIYMNFVQLTTGGGGWPLNVFLTPERLPFFGGTYFPPVNRYNMPSFKQVLTSIADAWATKRDEILGSAAEILSGIKRVNAVEASASDLSVEQLDGGFNAIKRTFDEQNGGFGGAPKFPSPMSLEFLLRYYHRTKDESALRMVERTCRKMANGGIYDQLGGGFHRYSVDAVWLVPHFEKMLYDNAQLARIYLHLFQVTKDEFHQRVAVETLDYVRREMLDPKGGFYSTQDADSEGVEGKFFVWTPTDVESLLGADEAPVFNFYYDISDDGNFEEKNILNVKNTIEETAEIFRLAPDRVEEILRRGRQKLFELRETRIKPHRDEKVLTAWNGLMLGTFAEAAAVLNRDDYLQIARQNADFILSSLSDNGYLLRSWKDGQAKLSAYLEDYANFADGLLDLFQVSGEISYFESARRLADLLLAEFWDTEQGGFFYTGENHEEMIVRSKDFFDNATPSGNSVAADVLLKLARLTGSEAYERLAASILRLVAPQMRRFPNGFGRVLSVMEFYLRPTREIIIFGESAAMKAAIWSEYLPNKIVVPAPAADRSASLPLLANRKMIDGTPTVYVCENFVCQRPVTTVEALREQLN